MKDHDAQSEEKKVAEIAHFDAQGQFESVEKMPGNVMESMSAAADAEVAKEKAAIPPPTEFPEPPPMEAPEFVSFEPDILSEMGKVAEMEAGLDKPVKDEPHPRIAKREASRSGNPFPFRMSNEFSPMDVMAEMGKAAEGERQGMQPPKVAGMPPASVDRMAFAGAEQEAVMIERFTGMLDGFTRVFDAQNAAMLKMADMLAEQGRKLNELDGYLERSRL